MMSSSPLGLCAGTRSAGCAGGCVRGCEDRRGGGGGGSARSGSACPEVCSGRCPDEETALESQQPYRTMSILRGSQWGPLIIEPFLLDLPDLALADAELDSDGLAGLGH